jgi:YtkA-like protein
MLFAACGDAEQMATTSPPLDFSGPPAQSVTTSSGQLTIDLRWSPLVPAKGIDAAELTFHDGAGNLVDGLTVTAVPWMPAHGHGTSVNPVMMSTGPGVQVATPVYFYMSGEWQLRVTIAGTTEDDTAVATVEIP